MTENKTRKVEDLSSEEWREISEHYAKQFEAELKGVRDMMQMIVKADDRVALFWFVDGINRLIEDAKKAMRIDTQIDSSTIY